MNIPKSILRFFLGKRLPITSGNLTIPGISKEVIIRRDRYSIPHIYAKKQEDAYYGLGFCQGQDRAFQLEMLLRVNRGTLSEIIGIDGLPIDRLSRRLGFNRYATGHYRKMGADAREKIDAFARGLYDGVMIGCKKLPHEFSILRTKPTPWTGIDVLAGGNYIAFGLSAWSGKLTRLILLISDGPDAVKALNPEYAEWLPVTKPVMALSGASLNMLGEDIEKLCSIFGLEGNSNNWSMNASRTSTGRPILANDPHLWPAIPTQWYLAHLEAPGLKVAGAAFLGAPNIPSGHNEFAAWGVTASLADNIDLFIEEIGDDDKTIKEGNRYVPCERRKEKFKIKGQPTFQEEIIITQRGPIISDVLDVDKGINKPYSLSLKAIWMEPQPVDGLIGLHHVKDFDSFREVLSKVRLVSQNFLFADVNNNIGWQYTSDVPQRCDAWGILPFPGWDQTIHWKSNSTPWEDMPYLFNPVSGFVSNANNKPVRNDNGTYLGRDWLEYRHARIVELLSKNDNWDIQSTQEMQLDRLTIPWKEMRTSILNSPTQTDEAELAIKILTSWDGNLTPTSTGAAVYEYFVISMIQRMAKAKAPNALKYALDEGFHPLVLRSFFAIRSDSNLVRNLRLKSPGWFEHGWDKEINDALSEAVNKLMNELGENPDNWSWGEIHKLNLTHPLGSNPLLGKIFNRGPFAYGGDHTTIAQAGRRSDLFGADVTGLANLRAVHDIGNWDNCRFVIAGGQSGNPFSPHYDDLLNIWLQGKTVSIAWSKDSVERDSRDVLYLHPEIEC